MKISVVVPTFRRPRLAEQTILSLARQTLPPNEIILVDNDPAEGDQAGDVRALVERLRPLVRHLRYLREPRAGVSIARNRGAGEASGDLVAFIDDDAVASPGWLEALAESTRRWPAAVAFAGPIDLRWSCRSPAWIRGLESWYGNFDLGDVPAAITYPRFPFASNLAFQREPFLSVGGFPVELGPRGTRRIANEEVGLFHRVADRGWTVMYEPRARVYHWVHAERLSRRYLLHRSIVQGRSDVLVDAMFEPARPRSQRAQRVVEALGGSVAAAAAAVPRKERRGAGSMRALVTAGISLGSAVQDAALALAVRPVATTARTASPRTGLTPEQRTRFAADGFVHLPAAFVGADGMSDRIWEHLARRGVDREAPCTWPVGKAHHLQKLLRDPVFVPIGGPVTTAAIDDLLGAGRWPRPAHWGELLVNFPEPGRRWTVPRLWHSDAAYTDPLDPLLGVMVFSFLNRVEAQSGGTLLLAGSHRLVARFAAGRPDVACEKTAVTRRAFYQSHPWLAALAGTGDDEDRATRFMEEVDIDGVPARVVELTGEAGDIVIVHPLMAHCVSPNCGGQPRFMRIIRPRLHTA